MPARARNTGFYICLERLLTAITVLIRYKYPVYPVYPCLNPSPRPLTPLPLAGIMAVTRQSLGEAKGYGNFFDGG